MVWLLWGSLRPFRLVPPQDQNCGHNGNRIVPSPFLLPLSSRQDSVLGGYKLRDDDDLILKTAPEIDACFHIHHCSVVISSMIVIDR